MSSYGNRVHLRSVCFLLLLLSVMICSATTAFSQYREPQPDFSVCLQSAGDVCVPVDIANADSVKVSNGGSWSNGTLCFHAPASGLYTVTTTQYSDNLILTHDYIIDVAIGGAPTLVCPSQPYEINLCSPGLVCIGMPLAEKGATTSVVSKAAGAEWANDNLCFLADSSGVYNFLATVSNACGADSCTITVIVNMGKSPVITCQPDFRTINQCFPGEACFPVDISGADSVWVDGGIWQDGQVCFTTTEEQDYFIKVYASNYCGVSVCEFQVYADITGLPHIGCVDSILSALVCELPGIATVPLQISNVDSVVVDGGDWQNGQLSFPVTQSGNHVIPVTAYNTCGSVDCSVSVDVIARSGAPFIACPFIELSATLCELPGVAEISLAIDEAVSVSASYGTWENGVLSFSADSAGFYAIHVSATNECGGSECDVLVNVSKGEKPVVACFEGDEWMRVCSLGDICLPLAITGAEQVSVSGGMWTNGNLCFDADHEGLYEFTVIASNDCGETSCSFGVNVSLWGTPAIACETKPAGVSRCGAGEVCLPSVFINNASSVHVSNGSWAFDQICFRADTTGVYTQVVKAWNECSADTAVCVFEIPVTLNESSPVVTCPSEPLSVSLCESGTACVLLPINGAAVVEVNGAKWSDGELCFTAEESGIYSFEVTASNACDQVVCTLAVAVSIQAPPTACFTPSTTSGKAPVEVTFSNCSVPTDGVTWLWTFGDGSYSSEFEPTKFFSVPGCYEVRLRAANACFSSEYFDTICVSDSQLVVPTPEWINIYCQNPTLDGVPLAAGDIISAFDINGILCGMGAVRDDGSYGFIPIYRDDEFSPEDEGATHGQPIYFRVNGTPVFPSPSVTWTSNGASFEICSFSETNCRELVLHEGWNLVSWNVAYSDELENMIADIEGCVDVILGFEQGALTYDPALKAFSTLQNVDYYSGYWFKMNCDAVVRLCAPEIFGSDYIIMTPGWNLVGYWPTETHPIGDALASLENLQVALGYDNGALVHIPGSSEYNTLTEMSPFFGYWIKSGVDDILAYPGFGKNADVSGARGSAPQAVATRVAPSRTWMSVYAKEMLIDNAAVTGDAHVEAFTQSGVLVGEGHYSGNILKFTPIYGADQSAVSYPHDGEPVQLFVNGVRTYPDIAFSSNGSRVDIRDRFTTASGSAEIPSGWSLAQNYPNPFNPTTNISFTLKEASTIRLTITNLLGQTIRSLLATLLPAGEHTVTWDACDDAGSPVSTGVYFYRLETPSFTQTRKMMLVK